MTRRSGAFRTWATFATVWEGDSAIVLAEQIGSLEDGSLRIVAANPAFEAQIGHDDATLPGLPFTYFRSPEHADRGWPALARSIRAGRPVSIRLPTRTGDGAARHLLWAFLPVGVTAAGPPIWFCRVFPDASDEVEVVESGRHGRHSLQAVVAVIDECVKGALLPALRQVNGCGGSDDTEERGALRRVVRDMLEVRRTIARRQHAANNEPAGRSAPDPAPLEVDGAVAMLTPREVEILGLIGAGLSRRQIAARLHRSAKTVDVHQASILRKLGLGSRAALIRFALRLGLVAS